MRWVVIAIVATGKYETTFLVVSYWRTVLTFALLLLSRWRKERLTPRSQEAKLKLHNALQRLALKRLHAAFEQGKVEARSSKEVGGGAMLHACSGTCRGRTRYLQLSRRPYQLRTEVVTLAWRACGAGSQLVMSGTAWGPVALLFLVVPAGSVSGVVMSRRGQQADRANRNRSTVVANLLGLQSILSYSRCLEYIFCYAGAQRHTAYTQFESTGLKLVQSRAGQSHAKFKVYPVLKQGPTRRANHELFRKERNCGPSIATTWFRACEPRPAWRGVYHLSPCLFLEEAR